MGFFFHTQCQTTSPFSLFKGKELYFVQKLEEEKSKTKKQQNPSLFCYYIFKFQLDEFQLKYPRGM